MPGLQFLISELLLALYLCLVEELLICNLTSAFSPPHKVPGTFELRTVSGYKLQKRRHQASQ